MRMRYHRDLSSESYDDVEHDNLKGDKIKLGNFIRFLYINRVFSSICGGVSMLEDT